MAKKLTLNFQAQLLTQTLEFFKRNFFNANSKSERIYHFRPCVYLAYLGSYGHLQIVKCIGMY